MKSVILPVLAVLISGPALADPLARIEGVSDPELRTALSAAIGEQSSRTNGVSSALRDARSAADRARRLLRARGYYAAMIEPRLDREQQALVQINPGPLFRIASVDTETGEDGRARETAHAAIDLETGAPLRAQSIIDAEARGLVALHGSGWPDAQIRERNVIVDHATDEGRITFRYEPGLWSTYGEIERETGAWNPQFIARISPFRQGAPASREEILEYQQRLTDLDSVIAADITLGAVGEDGNRPVSVAPTEAPRHSIETGLSYSTSEGGGGNVRWIRRNLFGNDETLTLSANAATLNQSLLAEIARPHWRRFNQTLTLHAGLTSEDTDAYQQEEAEIGAEITRRDGRRTYGVGPRLDWSRVTDSAGERDVVTAAVDLVAGYDSREDPLDPDSGIHGTIQVTPATTLGDCSCQYVRLEGRASTYYRLSESTVAALRMRVGSVFGASAADMPADQRFYAGGGGSARGFDYQSLSPLAPDGTPFGGISVVETSAELRWRVRDRWGVVGFVDAAMASSDRQPDFADLRTAVGLGVRYYLDFAPIRVDIATPVDRRGGEDAIQVYFSLGQAF